MPPMTSSPQRVAAGTGNSGADQCDSASLRAARSRQHSDRLNEGPRGSSYGWSGGLRPPTGDSGSLIDASDPDMGITDGHHDMPLMPQEPPSDAVVVPASSSFPSGSRPAALRALASLPFNIKRGSRRSTNHARDASPTPNMNHNSTELYSPGSQSRSRGLTGPPPEAPSAPAPTPSRPVVAFRNYKQFLFPRSGEIQSAPRTPPQPPPLQHSASDVNIPPPPFSFTHSNPLAEPQSPYARRHPAGQPPQGSDLRGIPDEAPQELSMPNHSRHPSAGSSEDENKGKKGAGEGARPDLAAGQLSELESKGTSFAVGRLRSEATMMALETGGSMMSHAAGPPGPNNSSFDGSTLPTPTREWRPRSIRSSKKISQGAEQRPGRHRYTYGNESIKSRQSAPSDVSQSPSRTTPAPRTRMVRQASNVSLVSTGTPLELKGDYESFMVADGEEVRDGGDKTQRGVLSKLAPYDAVNARSPAAQYAEPHGAGEHGKFGLPLSGPGDGKGRREWQPRFKRSKSKLELGGERSDGSSFAYSFMYGIGSEHEAAMHEVLRESRKERAQKRQLRRSESALSHATHEHAHASPGRAARGTADGGSLAALSAMSRMSGTDAPEGALEFGSWDGEHALLDPETDHAGSRGIIDFGGLSLTVGPSFKQYKFPLGRYFRFSDGNAVPVPFERRL